MASVVWHRLVFDPRKSRRNFVNEAEFVDWCSRHLGDFKYTKAGFTTIQWDHAVSSPGQRLWMVLIPGQDSYQTGETEILSYLADHHWALDDFDVIVYMKYQGATSEVLFPIHRRHAQSHDYRVDDEITVAMKIALLRRFTAEARYEDRSVLEDIISDYHKLVGNTIGG